MWASQSGLQGDSPLESQTCRFSLYWGAIGSFWLTHEKHSSSVQGMCTVIKTQWEEVSTGDKILGSGEHLL